MIPQAPQVDAYSLLGLRPGATPEQVKSAYRRLARELHPDVHPHASAKERTALSARFAAVAAAYRRLSDPAAARIARHGPASSDAGEHDMRDLCATCGKDWALHWVGARIPQHQIRPEARSCGVFVPKYKPPRRKPRPRLEPVPWWTLTVYKDAGYTRPMKGLTAELRCALRRIRAEDAQPRERRPDGCYYVRPDTAEVIERGEVDWRWFPESESARGKPWRPPPEMRAAMKESKRP